MIIETKPGILLDRDGTIIEDTNFINSIDDITFKPGAIEAIKLFNARGFPIAMVSNQGGVAYGFVTIQGVEQINACIAARLARQNARIDAYYYCPYHPNGKPGPFTRDSYDRKPHAGMAYAAKQALHLDLPNSWVIGDRYEDMAMAVAIDANGAFVGSQNDIDIQLKRHDKIWQVPSLAVAAEFIMERTNVSR